MLTNDISFAKFGFNIFSHQQYKMVRGQFIIFKEIIYLKNIFSLVQTSSQATVFVSILFSHFICRNRMDTKPVAWDNVAQNEDDFRFILV